MFTTAFHKCGQQSIRKCCLKENFHRQGSLDTIGLNKITCLHIEELFKVLNMFTACGEFPRKWSNIQNFSNSFW